MQKSYKAKLALNDCSFDIPVGSVTALVGPNGAGKNNITGHYCRTTQSFGWERFQLFESISPGSLQALQRLSFVAQNSTLNRK
ncbi:MAG: ATP-binding cassette domain-containing protein [Actinomycetota bacterium]